MIVSAARAVVSALALVYVAVLPARGQTAISVPAGFHAAIYASGLSAPTAMALGPDGRLYVAQQNGLIRKIGSRGTQTIARGFDSPLGLAWHARKLYVSSLGQISVLTPAAHFGRFSARVIVRGLPTGRHQNDDLVFHQGWLYIGVGSTCDACLETDARSATIMRFHPNGGHGQIFARGLRNPYGLAFHDGRLYATDNGRDDHGDTVPDELNLISRGAKYGWPDCWGSGLGTNCRGTRYPVALLPPHASADGLAFYTGHSFPRRFRGDAFIAEYGDTLDSLDTGHVVQRVHFSGKGGTVSTFATGFIHPLAIVATPGDLLVADYGTGIIWRIFA